MSIRFFKNLSLLSFIVLFSLNMVIGQQSDRKNISSLFAIEDAQFRTEGSLKKGVLLQLDETLLSRLYHDDDFSYTMSIPLNETEMAELELNQVKILSNDFILRTSGGDTLEYKKGRYYRGDIKGFDGFCSISFFEDHVAGIISIKDKGDYNLGKINGQRNSDYIIYNDRDLQRDAFECHTSDPDPEQFQMTTSPPSEKRYDDCVKIYIEGDFALNQDKGGVAPATDYITSLFNEVAAVYDAEDIGIEISEIMVWTFADGYSTNDAGDALDQFEANNPTFNGDLAQLFALGGNGIGGLAWLDVLCDWSPYAYENISSNFDDYPDYSWSVEVVSHEMGHNFGSPHTHGCYWNGNNTQIDDCGNEYAFNNGNTPEGNACFDNNNPIIPGNGGTVMSYCHLDWSVGIDLANGFGVQPGDLVRDRYNNASCISACEGELPDAPVAAFDADQVEICEGTNVQFYDYSTNTPTSWEWNFEGGDPDFSEDNEPNIYYEFAGTFDVSLLASNAGGEDEILMTDFVTVHEAPIAAFTYEMTDNNVVEFTNNSENSDYFLWEFGDGEVSSESNPTHTFEEDGTFDVFLYSGNNYCEDDFYSLEITIVTSPTAGMNISVSEGCKPLIVNFSDNSTSNVDSWSWTFEGGIPATSALPDPVITYENAGIYTVSLTVSNSMFSNMLTYADTIVVQDTPNAAFTPTITGNNVSFANSSTGANSFIWNFGDGNNSSEQNPTHTYADAGNYEVELIATNNCGNDTTTFDLTITLEAVAAFSVDNEVLCEGESAQFTSIANTQDVEWIFEGGNPANTTDINPVVEYSSAGIYTVTQYAYNVLGGDTLVMEDYIMVLADPTASYTSSINGYSVNFDQNLAHVQSFTWDFGDGNNSQDEDPTHMYAEDGSYTVVLTAYSTCDTIEVTQTVFIANPPTAAFSADVISGCADLTVQFTNISSSNSDEFVWTFSGGTPESSTEMNPTVLYNTPGEYSVLLQAINEQGQDISLQEGLISVLGVPDALFSYDSDLLTFEFTYSGNSTDQVTWNFGDGTTSNDLNPSHTYSSEGVYTVTLSASNDCGENTVMTDIEAAIKPEAAFDYSIDAGCAPLEVEYTDQSSGNPSSLLWLFEGGSPGASTDENPTITYYEGGVFTTQLIAFSGNGNDTITLQDIITVDAGPDPKFYFNINGPSVQFNNQTEDADSYIWNFGDGKASTDESPTHTYTKNGTYTVTLYASNDCGQTSKTITVTITTVNTIEALITDVKLFPNPNAGLFNLEMNLTNQDDLDIRIYDLLGKVIEEVSISPDSKHHLERFDLHHLNKGMYILDLQIGKEHKRMRFSIQ